MKKSASHLVSASSSLVLDTGCLARVDGGGENEQEGGKVEVQGTPVTLEDSNNLTADNTRTRYSRSRVVNYDVHGNPGVVNQGNTYNTYNTNYNYYRC